MIDALVGIAFTVLGIVVCIIIFLYARKKQKKEPIELSKYYGIQIFFVLVGLLCFIVLFDAITVIPRILTEEPTLVKDDCKIIYSETTKDRYLYIDFKNDLSFSVSPKNWGEGFLEKAYCEVTYYEGSEFGIHYKIYDQPNGTLLQQD